MLNLQKEGNTFGLQLERYAVCLETKNTLLSTLSKGVDLGNQLFKRKYFRTFKLS